MSKDTSYKSYIENIIFDKDYTNKYRDKYNAPCDCDECRLFRSEFTMHYPQVVEFLQGFGIDTGFPLEIMDNGINDNLLKREYTAYYAVKGELPSLRIDMEINDVAITMRNHIVANESYANTDIPSPFFIIELCDIFIPDNKTIFSDAVLLGREIEFSFNAKHYFESRKNENNWYVYCEETKEYQYFSSADEMIKDAIIEGNNINKIWRKISLNCIL